MSNYRYIPEKYKGRSSRYECPSCGKRGEFTRYIDTITGLHVHESVGICNRANKCGYHYPPSMYFAEGNLRPESTGLSPFLNISYRADEIRLPSYMPEDVMWKTMQSHAPNNFLQFLSHRFGVETAQQLASKYRIGTAKKWPGATVFWQVDSTGRIRGGKVMDYNSVTGKRIKDLDSDGESNDRISWAHTCLKYKDYNLKQCLFGEHLLREEPFAPVALVESEKTAIILCVFFPQFIWLATGGQKGLTTEKLQVLKKRKVTLFPDLKGYDMWEAKAREFSYLADFDTSFYLEQIATEEERKQGLDLADFIFRPDFNLQQLFETFKLRLSA